MFRIKLIILPLLFLVMCSPALTCDYGDGSKTNFCTCCNTTEVVIIETYCANSTHAVANVSCWFDSGDGYGLVYSTTEQAEYFSCYYGCDNKTGACIDPSGTNNFLFMVEIAFLSLIFVALVLFAVPLPDIYSGIKAVCLVFIFLVETWLFVILNIYSGQYEFGLFGTVGGWAGSLSNLLTWLMYFMLALVVVYFLYVFMKSRRVKEEE